MEILSVVLLIALQAILSLVIVSYHLHPTLIFYCFSALCSSYLNNLIGALVSSTLALILKEFPEIAFTTGVVEKATIDDSTIVSDGKYILYSTLYLCSSNYIYNPSKWLYL